MIKKDNITVSSKKIVFINQDSGYLMVDIVNSFAKSGFECSLIAGRIIERNSKLDPSVKKHRIIRYSRKNKFSRLITWCWAFIQIYYLVKLNYRRDKLFIVSNPPIATLLPLLVSNPFSLLIFDIYPDSLVEYNFLKSESVIIKWWQNANKKIFTKSDKIFTLTDSMSKVLHSYTDKVIEVVPIWSDGKFLKPVPKEKNIFIGNLGLTGKFIVLYSGNMGISHHIEILAEMASKVTNPNVFFLFIGEGERKKELEGIIKARNLQNCLLLPWQSTETLPYSLASADIAIVSSSSSAAKLSIPSKVYSLLAVGVPLLCISPPGSELDHLVTRYQNGKCFNPSDIDGINDFIIDLASNKDKLSAMAQNSLKASENFTPENVKKIVH